MDLRGTIQDLVDETRNKSIRKVEMTEMHGNDKYTYRSSIKTAGMCF